MRSTFPQFVFCSLVFFCIAYSTPAQVLIQGDTGFNGTADSLTLQPGALNFIAMGDWGRNGADHQKLVATQMGKTAAAAGVQFIISTGDNFYPSGVISEQDPLFKYSFEDIYTAFSLQWDWYLVLGNHDYKSNPDAQVAYSKISRRWKMPARYYAKKIALAGDTTQQVLIAFIDTNPLIPEFYENAEYGPNVRSQDSAAQKRWLIDLLSTTSPNVKWKIVVGHHPMFTGGNRTEGYDTKAIRNTLKPVLDKYGVDVYLSGHEHSLQYLKPEGKTHHFISGAASEKTPVKLVPESRLAASAYGYMLFSMSKSGILVQTIDDAGKIIYKVELKK
ncbi:MAG: tartrate-resistant acid phosphatase type 5 family protein [Bacteroidota bacterium]